MTNGDNLPNPSEVDAGNIIKPSLEELSEDHRRAYEEQKKACEDKELEDFLGNFKKDLYGNIAPVGEIKFPPLHVEQVKPSVSTTDGDQPRQIPWSGTWVSHREGTGWTILIG